MGKIRLKLKRSAKKKPSRVAKLKDPQTSRRYELRALKPFHSTSAWPVHRKEIGTLQHQCEGQCRNCYWMQKRHRVLDIRQNLEPYRWQEGGKEEKRSGIYKSKSTGWSCQLKKTWQGGEEKLQTRQKGLDRVQVYRSTGSSQSERHPITLWYSKGSSRVPRTILMYQSWQRMDAFSQRVSRT